MNSTVERRITGFYLRPKFEWLNGEEVVKGVELELLQDGYAISTESYNGFDSKGLDRLQELLLKNVIMNLDLEDNWTESRNTAKRSKVLGVVNMFKIEAIDEHEDGSQDIKVTFLRSGYFLSESTFVAVSKEKVKEIKEILVSNTVYNLRCDKQCRAITLIDLIASIDQKL